MLDEDRLAWMQDWQFLAMRFVVTEATYFLESGFDMSTKVGPIVVDWSRQSVAEFATEEELGR